MLNRLLASTLILGNAVVLSAPSTYAQTTDIPFSGTVEATGCTFGTPTAGRLIPDLPVNPTALVGHDQTSGASGSVTVFCVGFANITMSAPVQVSGPSFSPTSCTTFLRYSPSLAFSQSTPVLDYGSCGGTSPSTSNAGGTYWVGMRVSNNSGIPSGTYNYKVTLTIVP
jgi:hypothetical protein